MVSPPRRSTAPTSRCAPRTVVDEPERKRRKPRPWTPESIESTMRSRVERVGPSHSLGEVAGANGNSSAGSLVESWTYTELVTRSADHPASPLRARLPARRARRGEFRQRSVRRASVDDPPTHTPDHDQQPAGGPKGNERCAIETPPTARSFMGEPRSGDDVWPSRSMSTPSCWPHSVSSGRAPTFGAGPLRHSFFRPGRVGRRPT